MQETLLEKLQPILVQKLNEGADLGPPVSSTALAKASPFGGQDYTGYHTFMALMLVNQMSGELPREKQALTVLKVLYRNSSRMQDQGRHAQDSLHRVTSVESVTPNRGGQLLPEAMPTGNRKGAERVSQ